MSDPRDNGKGWIGVDLDGTLAETDGEAHGPDHIGPPVAAMVERVRAWLDEGKEVRILTARAPHPAIRRFCKEHFGKVLKITNQKDHEMCALYDDRAVGIRRNVGEPFHTENEEQVGL